MARSRAGPSQGPRGNGRFLHLHADGWNVFLQGLQSGVVVLDAADTDHATGRWFVHEVGQRAEGTNVTIDGVYHDEYRREAGLWLIMRRRYDPLLRSTDGAAIALPFPTDVRTIG